MNKAENAAYATAYWFANCLCPGVFLKDKAESAAEVAIRHYAATKSAKEALSYVQTYRLCGSEFWKSL